MRTIELVTHCYCPPGLGVYAQHLKWQIASVVNYPCDAHVTLTVFTAGAQDHETMKVIQEIGPLVTGDVYLQAIALPPGELFRRAIGRNKRALATKADVLWFTDVDYLFGPGCLDAVVDQVDAASGLCMPAEVHLSFDHDSGNHHAVGDAMVLRAAGDPLPSIDPSLFKSRRQRICIGGVQIVGRELANSIGYLAGTSKVEPVDPAAGFRSCRCDKWWRKWNNLSATRLPIPSVYRIRHGSDGRDFDLRGEKVGKEAW